MPFYSGCARYGTIVTPASLSDFITAIKDAMVDCGWSATSNGTDDWILTAGASHPQGLDVSNCKVRWVVTSGNAYGLLHAPWNEYFLNWWGTFNDEMILLYNSTYTYEYFGNKWQFFIRKTPYGGASKYQWFVTIPWVPASVVASPNFYTGAIYRPRTNQSNFINDAMLASGSMFCIRKSTGDTDFTKMELQPTMVGSLDKHFHWVDGTGAILQPLFACNTDGFATNQFLESPSLVFYPVGWQIQGGLWDCFIGNKNQTRDNVYTYDSRDWVCTSTQSNDANYNLFFLKTEDA